MLKKCIIMLLLVPMLPVYPGGEQLPARYGLSRTPANSSGSTSTGASIGALVGDSGTRLRTAQLSYEVAGQRRVLRGSKDLRSGATQRSYTNSDGSSVSLEEQPSEEALNELDYMLKTRKIKPKLSQEDRELLGM